MAPQRPTRQHKPSLLQLSNLPSLHEMPSIWTPTCRRIAQRRALLCSMAVASISSAIDAREDVVTVNVGRSITEDVVASSMIVVVDSASSTSSAQA